MRKSIEGEDNWKSINPISWSSLSRVNVEERIYLTSYVGVAFSQTNRRCAFRRQKVPSNYLYYEVYTYKRMNAHACYYVENVYSARWRNGADINGVLQFSDSNGSWTRTIKFLPLCSLIFRLFPFLEILGSTLLADQPRSQSTFQFLSWQIRLAVWFFLSSKFSQYSSLRHSYL